MNKGVVLSVKNVSKEVGRGVRGGSLQVLSNVSFDLHKSEILGIIGANGAGKSTLLKILSEITTPTSGTVEYTGRLRSILEVGTGFHPDLTGKENVYLSGNLHGLTKGEIDSRYEDLVNFSGLNDFMDMPVKQYSSGMYLRLAFSVAFHSKMDVLVVDEVLSVGDLSFITKCHERVREIARKGVAIILVTHNTSQVVEFCNRCLHLKEGKVVNSGDPLDVVQGYIKHIVQQSRGKLRSVKHEGFRVRNISVNGVNGTPEIGMSKTIQIQFEAFNEADHGTLEFNLTLADMNGKRLLFDGNSFRERYDPVRSEKGWYSVKCAIPKNLLNRGYYFVGVIKGNDRKYVGEIADLCSFVVYPDNEDRDVYTMMGCPFTLNLEWEIEKQS